MVSTVEYLARKQKSLRPNYTRDNGRHLESCWHVATDVARRLLDEGKEPEIVTFTEGTFSLLKPMVPKEYEGKVTWYAHHVCVADGMSYDPIIGEPVPINEYCQRAFGEDFKMQVSFPHKKLVEIFGTKR